MKKTITNCDKCENGFCEIDPISPEQEAGQTVVCDCVLEETEEETQEESN